MRRRGKLGNTKVIVDGITFDSKREAKRYSELKLLLMAGEIQDLQLQKRYELIPAHYKYVPTGELYKIGELKGTPKMKKTCIEKGVEYIADFVYKKDGTQIVEDVKGFKTKDYIIKRKLMLHVHGIRVKEV